MSANKCISCGHSLSHDLVDVGQQFPSAIFLRGDEGDIDALKRTSLNLCRCSNESCSLVQLSEPYDLQYVFDNYPYESGKTASMDKILLDLVQDAISACNLGEDDIVLDIGGNDGTMLSLIEQPVRALVNIDAAAKVKQVVSRENYFYSQQKFSSNAYKEIFEQAPRLITSTAMFYHLSDPYSFTRDVAEIMNLDSLWVLQMTYLGSMLEYNIFDNIVHEHVGYYSLKSLESLLNRCGLKVVNAKIVDSYGGSMRVYICKEDSNSFSELDRTSYETIKAMEADKGTNTPEALIDFNAKLQFFKKSFKDLILHLAEIDGPLYGFGASTKGNMLLQLIGADSSVIKSILDNSSKKIGRRTTGSMIEILSESENILNIGKYVLVLPYYYLDSFISIFRRILPKGQFVYLVSPLPSPSFVRVDGESSNR